MGYSIIVGSGKGGVGKTNIAVNLGIALSELGKDVALIDGSLTTPDVSLHLGVPFHVLDLSQILKAQILKGSPPKDVSFTHKSGLSIIPGNVHINDLNEFEGSQLPELLEKLKKEHDFVLVDCAAGLGREAVSAICNCDKMLVVTNPELPSVVNSSKAIKIAKYLNVEPIGVVLNRVGRFRQELKEEDIELLLNDVPIIGRIPEDKRIAIATRKSEAVINHSPNCRASREFREIALHLSGKKREEKETLLGRLSDFIRNPFKTGH